MTIKYKLLFDDTLKIEKIEAERVSEKLLLSNNGFYLTEQGEDYRVFDYLKEANECRTSYINSLIDKYTKEINDLEELLNVNYSDEIFNNQPFRFTQE